MKYLSEFRDPEQVQRYLDTLQRLATRPWTIMEICGGQTHSLVKNGILGMLPPAVTMVHGPGCPVCVTPLGLIDDALMLAREKGVILCSFGDMLRVPGTRESLLEAKAAGADVRIVYSPLEALELARRQPDRQVVFFAVGFETTAPANALSVVQAAQLGVDNYTVLASHVLVPPAMEAILADPDSRIDAFLAAGHVCTIMGLEEYQPIVERYQVPVIVTGFEPLDLLQGITMAVRQLEAGEARLENQYTRVVQPEGNRLAQDTIQQVFEVSDREWRGIGTIPGSGYAVREDYARFDARRHFGLSAHPAETHNGCQAGEVLKGRLKPRDCPYFGKGCSPETPMGAPMVSSEGACAAYYHFHEPLAG